MKEGQKVRMLIRHVMGEGILNSKEAGGWEQGWQSYARASFEIFKDFDLINQTVSQERPEALPQASHLSP